MLPGIRFLLATMLLGVSLAICGIGATALFRVAQENSASLPSLQALRDPFPPAPVELPTIALMRIEVPAATVDATVNEETASSVNSPIPASQPDVANAAPLADQSAAANSPPDVQRSNAAPESNTAAAQKPDDKIAAAEPQKPANETLAEKAGDDAKTTAATAAATEPSIVMSKTQDAPSQEVAPPQQNTPTAEVEKATSATAPDADANLATGSLPAAGEAVPSPKPKPVVSKARVTKRVVRRAPIRRVAPRPQAAAKQTSPFGL